MPVAAVKKWSINGRKKMIKGIHHISMKCGRADELTNVRKFYIDILGLKIIRE